ncbi:MAG: YggS family pyridoxal phosphate-dependent enzyme [Lachnospiraceae bacterium]|nr:YggS family pyridoxal phosphate-dependent enzyme [Lachnospiraceae bacterium]
MIQHNIQNVQQKINAVCNKISKDFKDIHLIAVSKTKPVSMLQEAYDVGIRDFGENKVQEILEKYDKLPSDIRWHMIGHLQRNKVKYIIDKVSLIHSVDSLRLAEEISKEAVKHNITMPILIEINMAEEESKFGISYSECEEMLRIISQLPNIQIKGLMTVAPFVDNPEDNRQYFKSMKQLSVDIMTKNIDNICMDVLSMGMTGDYEVAIEEGSNMVRVGTGIFGERNYQ